ncbi:MAG TPA: hypothetical protein VN743_03035 [Blastocatellia bacterium]|nr:hypothetical protein [Blastocatellia bacterium]
MSRADKRANHGARSFCWTLSPPLIGNAGICCRINAAIDGRFRPEAAALKYGAHPYNLMPSAQRFKI